MITIFVYKREKEQAMSTITSLLIDSLINASLVVPVIWCWQRACRKDAGCGHRWLVVLFGCGLAEIFALTGIPSIWRINLDPTVNLIPFDGMLASPVQFFLNIILFMPVGILAPLIWDKLGRVTNILLLGGGLSFFIEFMQLFNFRATDLDDLIANTAGALIGFLIVKIIAGKRIGGKARADKKEGREVMILCSLVFLINFTIQPLLSEWVWSLLL